MTRHAFEDGLGQRWIVGYDKAVASYFAQIDKPEDAVTVAGSEFGEVRSVDQLKERLKDQVQIPKAMENVLRAEGPKSVDDKMAGAAQRRVRATYESFLLAPQQSAER